MSFHTPGLYLLCRYFGVFWYFQPSVQSTCFIIASMWRSYTTYLNSNVTRFKRRRKLQTNWKQSSSFSVLKPIKSTPSLYYIFNKNVRGGLSTASHVKKGFFCSSKFVRPTSHHYMRLYVTIQIRLYHQPYSGCFLFPKP